MPGCRAPCSKSGDGARMLKGRQGQVLFLPNCRHADAANVRCSRCEVRYKPVGFGRFDC